MLKRFIFIAVFMMSAGYAGADRLMLMNLIRNFSQDLMMTVLFII